MIETSAKPLPAPLLGAPSPAARRLAPDSSHALTPAAAVDAAPGQSGRAPTPRAPYEAPVSSSSSSSPALRASSQLSRWSRARALRSGRRLEVGLDRVAVSSAPPPQDKQPPALLHDDTPAAAFASPRGTRRPGRPSTWCRTGPAGRPSTRSKPRSASSRTASSTAVVSSTPTSSPG
ncbi:unnamed protein product [Urochloa humidicola]